MRSSYLLGSCLLITAFAHAGGTSTWTPLSPLPPGLDIGGVFEQASVRHRGFVYTVLEDFGRREVWRTIDGIDWTRVNDEAPWELNQPFGFTSLGDHLLVVDGNRTVTGPAGVPEAFLSTDGVAWSRWEIPGAFDARDSFPLVAFNGRAWLLGGNGVQDGPSPPIGVPPERNDVWSTANGIDWRREPDAPWAPRFLHMAVVHAGRLHVLGGVRQDFFTFELIQHTDVWSTADGVTWREETASAPFGPRWLGSTVSFSGALYLIGGNQELPAIGQVWLNDVWRSVDGATWELVTENAVGLTPRARAGAVAIGRRLFLIGGVGPEAADPAIVYTDAPIPPATGFVGY